MDQNLGCTKVITEFGVDHNFALVRVITGFGVDQNLGCTNTKVITEFGVDQNLVWMDQSVAPFAHEE